MYLRGRRERPSEVCRSNDSASGREIPEEEPNERNASNLRTRGGQMQEETQMTDDDNRALDTFSSFATTGILVAGSYWFLRLCQVTHENAIQWLTFSSVVFVT